MNFAPKDPLFLVLLAVLSVNVSPSFCLISDKSQTTVLSSQLGMFGDTHSYSFALAQNSSVPSVPWVSAVIPVAAQVLNTFIVSY